MVVKTNKGRMVLDKDSSEDRGERGKEQKRIANLCFFRLTWGRWIVKLKEKAPFLEGIRQSLFRM